MATQGLWAATWCVALIPTLEQPADRLPNVTAGSRRLTIFIVHPSELLTDHLPHGDGRVAWGFIHELGRRGHRVHVACQRIDLAEPPPANVTLHIVPLRKKTETARLVEYMVRCGQLYRRLARHERFDVAHQLNPVFTGLSLALTGTRVPIVLGPYVAQWPFNWEGERWKFNLRHVLTRRVLVFLQQRNAAALLVTTNAAVETKVIPMRSIRARVRKQQLGIDLQEFAPDESIRARALSSKRILFLANLGVRKGIFTLIDAFALVHALEPEARLIIAGDGPARHEVEAQIAKLGLTDAVEIAGNVKREEVAGIMHTSAVYCLPSLGEPYGMSAVEAMAAGLPLVVTNTGGLSELVDDAGAIRVPHRDAPALARAILTLFQSPQRAMAMGDHNLRRARTEFAWNIVVDSLESAYHAVCEAAPAR